METHQKLTLRALLLEQLLQDTAAVAASLHAQLGDFKQSLRRLEEAYSVVLLTTPGEQNQNEAQSLAGRPLQLLISPREAAASSLHIRVSGVLKAVDASGLRLDFKPSAVDISRSQAAPERDAFQDEIDSAQHLIAHVHQVLKVLRHEGGPVLALSA